MRSWLNLNNNDQWPYNSENAYLRINEDGPFGHAARFNQCVALTD